MAEQLARVLVKSVEASSSAPMVDFILEKGSETGSKLVVNYRIEYYAYSAARTSVNKQYEFRIGGKLVASGSYDINGKTGTHLIKSGSYTITKTTSAQSLTILGGFGFHLTWGGIDVGAITKTTTLSVAAQTKYTISYNANGGTGAPSSQTKYQGEAIVLSSAKPTRTGYTFSGWDATSPYTTAEYQPGASYTGNATVTLYAVWSANTYAVRYNANGGSGAPSTQTKTHGVALTLSSAPDLTRSGYTFLGWATSASGAVAYQPGGSYTENAAVTLYAKWELAYKPPKIYNIHVEWDTGINAVFDWVTSKTNPTGTIEFYDGDGSKAHSESIGTLSGMSGHFETSISSASLNPDVSYEVKITIKDSGGSSTSSVILTGTMYPIDVLCEGKGVAFGKPAELAGIADFGYTAKFTGGIQNIVLSKYNNLNDVVTPNTYVSVNRGATYYTNCPITEGTFTLEVVSAGAEGQVLQRLTTTYKDGAHEVYVRHYFQSSWGSWVCVYGGDTGWVDLVKSSGISVGNEMKYLKGRVKDGVLYIKGDVRGITANWTQFATLPSILLNKCSSLLAENNRFTGVYNVTNSVALNLRNNGTLLTTSNPTTGSWYSTYDLSINVAICL